MTDEELIEWVRVQLVTATLTGASQFKMLPAMRDRFYKLTGWAVLADLGSTDAQVENFNSLLNAYESERRYGAS